MRTKKSFIALGALACAGVVFAAPTFASAVPSPTSTPSGAALATIQAKAAAAISARLASLNQAIRAVTANTVITGADKATLLATLNGDVSGLTELGHTISVDTTAKQAATDAATIYTTYRVYALALPQVRYAEVADDLAGGVLPKLTDAQTKLAALLAGADATKDTPAVQAAMTDLVAKVSAASTATNGMSITVLAYTPTQYDANHGLLDVARLDLVSARADIKTARADIATVLGALK